MQSAFSVLWAVVCFLGLGMPSLWSEVLSPRSGEVFFLRHALAPGSGDPAGMTLDDRNSQRNLNEAGRAQARELGEQLRAEGISHAIVYTSAWWRCEETALLLGFGEPIREEGLNSFWQRPADRDPILARAREFLAELPLDGPPVILVTHYVNILGLTGRAVGSGQGFWLPLEQLREGVAE
jgi:broad specificity phosphatase PhoE